MDLLIYKANLFEEFNINRSGIANDEYRFKDDVVDVKMIKDLKKRSLSIGEGGGGRDLMNRIGVVQVCDARGDEQKYKS